MKLKGEILNPVKQFNKEIGAPEVFFVMRRVRKYQTIYAKFAEILVHP